ncbi:MAG: YegP family protein [Acidobacteriota bacterium]
MAGKFELAKSTNGKFFFRLKAGNGEKILGSEMYETKAAATNGIESVKKNAGDDSRYEKKTSNKGDHFFNLKASNGQVIGSSEMYSTESGMNNGIESVKKNAPDAAVDDQA